MATLNLSNSLPRVVVLGVKDNSTRVIPTPVERIPMHAPLCPILTEWGPTESPIPMTIDAFNVIYGKSSLDPKQKYFTSQTLLMERALQSGNICFPYRLKTDGSTIARVRLSVDVTTTNDVEVKQLNDTDFSKELATTTTITQKVIRFKLESIPSTAGANVTVTANLNGFEQSGVASTGTATQSTTNYPLFDFEARFYGARGNRYGFRIIVPEIGDSAVPLDTDKVNAIDAMIYNLQAVYKDENGVTTIVPRTDDETTTQFTLKPNTFDPYTNVDLNLEYAGTEGYEFYDKSENATYGPFRRIATYQDSITDLLGDLFEHEKTQLRAMCTTTPANSVIEEFIGGANRYHFNLFSLKTKNGLGYKSVVFGAKIDNGAPASLTFGSLRTHWLKDGSDGFLEIVGAGANPVFDTTTADYIADQLTGRMLDSVASNPAHPFFDRARYPFTTMYDSGYSIETKNSMANLLALQDVYINVATYTIAGVEGAFDLTTRKFTNVSGRHQSSPALVSNFLRFPESVYYGTATDRVAIIADAGRVAGHIYRKWVPFTYSLMKKCALYMGSQTGYMRSEYNFETAMRTSGDNDGNIIRDYAVHDVKFKSEASAKSLWGRGVIFAQSFDTKTIFWPALQTIHPNNTSILRSYIPMIISVDLIRVGMSAWRRHVGDSSLTNGEFADAITKFIISETENRYMKRAEIIPNVYYTKEDSDRGYVFHVDIGYRANGTRNIEVLSVISDRRGE